MPAHTQNTLPVIISSPLGKDQLLFRSMQGEERISGLFHFALELGAEDNALDFDAIVGQSLTVTLQFDGGKRHINGIVGRFAEEGGDERFTTYQADLYPWLWLLTLTADSKIFQNQTVPQIIEKVFTDLGFTDYRNALKGSYAPREYCVQYQESAFNFVSRLMEDEGICYFFEHSDGKHTLVLADDADAHQPCPGLESTAVHYRKSAIEGTDDHAITRCTIEQQVVTGKYAMDDFNFETPSTDLIASVNGNGNGGQSGKLRIYEYPGGFTKKDAGDKRAKMRIESREWAGKLLRGESYCRAFASGYKFKLTDYDRTDVNGAYILRQVSHQATQESYTNSFEAYPVAVPFRPERETPRPVIAGIQTAQVVGKSGEEIWTDKYGRIKVQFHWDQLGKGDENSSCWIRVNQGWAGKQWGSIFLPRLGQEVIVSFLEGDPARPVVTGALYNAEQIVPYTLPDDQTKSTIKSNTSKGGAGYNELRFEDKKDSEEIFCHAQKDLTIKVEHDRTATVQEGNETLTVEKGNRTILVNTGNETHEVKGTRALTVTGNETHTNKANFEQDVTGNVTWKVTGNLTIDVTGAVAIKAGTAMTNEAGTTMTSKGNAANNVESSGIVAVKGALVKLN